MNVKAKLLKNIASLGVAQLASLLFPVISLPYLASVLGSTGLGEMALAISLSQIFVVITDYGFSLTATKAVAQNRHDDRLATELVFSVTFIKLFIATLGIVTILAACRVAHISNSTTHNITLAYVAVYGSALFPTWLYQGLEQFRLVVMIQMTTRLMALVSIFVFVHSEHDVGVATFIQAVPPLLCAIISVPFLIRNVNMDRVALPDRAKILRLLKESWHVFASTSAVTTYTTANVFVLGLFVSPAALAQYHVAERIVRALQGSYGAINSAIYPHISALAKSNGADGIVKFNARLLALALCVSCLLFVIVASASGLIVQDLFGAELLHAATILKILSANFVLIAVSNVLGIHTMLPLGQDSSFGRIILRSAALNCILFPLACYHFGALGAAMANVAVELYVVAAMGAHLHRAGWLPLLN